MRVRAAVPSVPTHREHRLVAFPPCSPVRVSRPPGVLVCVRCLLFPAPSPCCSMGKLVKMDVLIVGMTGLGVETGACGATGVGGGLWRTCR
jgi:hypothetical protein